MTSLFGRTKFYSLFLATALLLTGGPAFAEKRVALVIGNAAYQNVPRLPNPVNDGNTIATTLKNAGFDVVDSRHDLPASETRRALRDFADRARDADIAVVYYAGHGIEVDGGNYLIPIDAEIRSEDEIPIAGVDLGFIRADKSRAFSRFTDIKMNLSNIQLTLNDRGDKITAVFDKGWRFSGERTSTGKVRQQLELSKVDGRWLITSEKDIKVY